MSTFAVFCTAQLPEEALEMFEKLSTSGKTVHNNPSPWLFFKSPSNTTTRLVVGTPTSSFTTGFLDATPNTLRDFLQTRFTAAKDQLREAEVWELSDDSYTVLDERSIRDSTCEIHYDYRYMPTPEGYVGNPPDWVKEELIHEWRIWRVKYRTAWYWLSALGQMPEDLIRELDAGGSGTIYVDEGGVLQMAYSDKHEFDYLEDRAPYRRTRA